MTPMEIFRGSNTLMARSVFNPTALGKPTTVARTPRHHDAPNGAFHTFAYGNGIAHTMIPNERGLPEFPSTTVSSATATPTTPTEP